MLENTEAAYPISATLNKKRRFTLPSAPGTVTTVAGSLPGTSLLTITYGAVTFSNFQAVDASGGSTVGLPISYLAGVGTAITTRLPGSFNSPSIRISRAPRVFRMFTTFSM